MSFTFRKLGLILSAGVAMGVVLGLLRYVIGTLGDPNPEVVRLSFDVCKGFTAVFWVILLVVFLSSLLVDFLEGELK